MGKPPSTRVMEIFSEAATGDAARREEYLELACGGDPELRAEVESLLRTQQHADRFLNAPSVDDDLLESRSGVVGRYTILKRIGEGGFGAVYAARQDHPIRRDVALKIVKLGMDTRQIIRRFESERQAVALMDHPGIARIYDAGATPDGRPYFAMELVRGSPITDYCDAERLTVPRRLELFMAVCHAVQHAHQKGMIHRDLKPSNILVAIVDGKPVPKVIDFGIAKAIASPGDHTACTEARHFVGTPQYMSPEQAGGGTDVDTRTDVYSLGVLLYELLTGATPFDAEALRRAPFDEVSRVIREEEPAKPSTRLTAGRSTLASVAERRGVDGQRLCRSVGGELDWIVGRAMEKDRRLRYQTVGALLDDVRRHLAHEPLIAGPPEPMYRVRKFTRRYRKPLLAAGAVALALVMGLAGTTFGLVRAKRDRARAEAALAQAEQVSRFLADMLRSADPDRAKGKDLLVRDILDKTSASIDQGALAAQPLVEAGIRATLGDAYESLGLYPESESHIRKALEIRQRVQGPDHPDSARVMAALAWAVHNRADADEAERLARRALAVYERTFGPNHGELVNPLVKLALILRFKRDIAGAEAHLRRAFDLCRSGAADRNMYGFIATNLGVNLMDQGKYAEAEPLVRDALALARERHGDNVRNVQRNLSNLAVILSKRGEHEAAEAMWLEALAKQRSFLPENHPDTAWTLRLLGLHKRDRGDLAAAEKYVRASLEMERRVFQPGHPVIAMLLDDLAEVLRRGGRRREAAEARKEAVGIGLANAIAAAEAHPTDGSKAGALAVMRLRNGEFAAGAEELERAAGLDPNPQWPLQAACTKLYAGDDAGYRQARGDILRRFGDTTDPETAAWVARACALAPLSAEGLAPVLRLARRGPADSEHPKKPFYLLCRGVVELRADRPEAVDVLTRCLASNPDVPNRVTAGCYLSLALRRQGDTQGAAAALASALAAAEQLPAVEDGDIGADPEEWMVAQIALREARAAAPEGTQ